MRLLKKIIIVVIFICISFTILPQQASSVTFTVINTSDDGVGSLRQAIINANGTPVADNIYFDPSLEGSTITLFSQLPDITGEMSIVNSSAGAVIIEGNFGGARQNVFNVTTGNLTLQNLKIANSATGLIINSTGTATVTNCIFDGNSATNGSGIDNSGTLIVTNSIFFNNTSTSIGGGIYNRSTGNLNISGSTLSANSATLGGGLFNHGTLFSTGCTISANSAVAGGGLYSDDSSTLINCTLTGNTASTSGGALFIISGSVDLTNCSFIYNNSGIYSDATNTNIRNCILWDIDALIAIANVTYSDVRGGFAGTGNIDSDPLLGALGDYGGSVKTVPILPGSPVINAGDSGASPATDARGVARPVGSKSDMGAFESQGFILTATAGTPQTTLINTGFATSLGLTITSADSVPVDGSQITFAAPASGASAIITGSPATTSGAAVSVVATANGTAGTYDVTASIYGAASVNFHLTNTLPTSNSTISPVTATFDRYSGSIGHQDIQVDMTLNGNSLVNISNGVNNLTPGVDYTVVGNTVTIKKTYLTAQPTNALTFQFSAGINPTLTISVNDTTPQSNNSSSRCSSIPVRSTTGLAFVCPRAGGTISLGNEVLMAIPAGAMKGTQLLKVEIFRVSSPPSVPSGLKILGTAYEFKVDKQAHYSLITPVTLTFAIDPKMVSIGTTPTIFYYDTANSKWNDLGGTISDNTITTTVNDLTIFAVMTGQQPVLHFSDVGIEYWAIQSIEKLAALGVIKGFPDGTFRPDNFVSRAEFASMLVKALKLQNSGYSTSFKDISKNWAKDSITIAQGLGIVSGYPDKTFRPQEFICREEVAAIAMRASGIKPANGSLTFTDSQEISPWAKNFVLTMVNNGTIKAYSDNTFRPRNYFTRAEAVDLILSLIKQDTDQ